MYGRYQEEQVCHFKSDSINKYYYKVVPYKIGLGQKEMEGERSNVAINDKTVELMIFMGRFNMAGRI
ncbi:MAG: hypothetical protein HDT39_16860 [Lachnospiraceae bacterium]|nr:hypothetical protein [Lachnospiraceae bacterium]